VQSVTAWPGACREGVDRGVPPTRRREAGSLRTVSNRLTFGKWLRHQGSLKITE